MGGLVTRSALNKCVASHSCNYVKSFTSISTPFNGSTSATTGADLTQGAVPVWTDMDPKGKFLVNLFNAPLPKEMPHYLLFGVGSDNTISFGKNDGSVSLASQLRLEAQEQAKEIRGFDNGHVSILSSKEVLAKLFGILDDN